MLGYVRTMLRTTNTKREKAVALEIKRKTGTEPKSDYPERIKKVRETRPFSRFKSSIIG